MKKDVSTKRGAMFLSALAIVVVVLLAVQTVDAYRLLCLARGETAGVDEPHKPFYECNSDLCRICVTDSGTPGVHPNKCNDLGACESSGAVDSEPPEVTVTSPVDGAVYSERRVPFIIDSNERCLTLLA